MKTLTSILLFTLLLFFSCASLPKSTGTLTNEILKEGNQMHTLNIALVNQLFQERLERINLFIENRYTPTLIKKYESLLPDTLNYKKSLPAIVEAIVPVVNRKKDSITTILIQQNKDAIAKLNANFKDYSKATATLQALINSVTKVNSLENQAINSIENLTGTKKEFTKVDNYVKGLLEKVTTDIDKIIK